MANYAWVTDIHLDFLSDERVISFAQGIVKTNADGVIISGDISVAGSIVTHLALLERVIQRPIYFVLGNHDYYMGSIAQVRKQMSELEKISPFLKYLPNTSYHMLNTSTAIVGHDTWYDVINGRGPESRFIMNDWRLIKEYAEHAQVSGMYGQREVPRNKVVEVSRTLAHEGVVHIQKGIKESLRYARKVIVVSHVPPFADAHMHEGHKGNDEAHPWFTCKLLGDMLSDASKAFPDRQFISLSGHTHGKYEGKFANNLEVLVGGAEYGTPDLARIISV